MISADPYVIPDPYVAGACATVAERLRRIIAPRPRLNIWQYADQYRYLARGVSARSQHGSVRYRSADAPHQREPQESFTDPAVQITVLIMASQIGGKTEMINNALGYHMHWSPANCVVMYPTIDSAEKYSKKKFTPMVRATPELDALLAPARSRDSGNTILVKEFDGGSIFFVGANSTPSLRQASGAVLIADEIDSADSSAGDEGDPIELLWKRGESFPRCVKILSSTPTIKGSSPIWSAFEDSDQRYWHVPCARCHDWITYDWSMVQWPKDQPEKAVMICPRCSKELTDRHRVDMYHAGEWRPTAAFLGIRGYHLNGLYCPWPAGKGYKNRLHQSAVEFRRAVKKGREAIKVRRNTYDCLTWEEEGDRLDDTELLKRREDYGPALPDAILLLTFGLDTQGDRLELEVVGWGADEESWGVQYKIFPGNPLLPRVWAELDRWLNTASWKTCDGRTLNLTAGCLDMGGGKDREAFADMVLSFCKPRFARRIFAIKGSSQPAAPLVVGPSRRNRRRCPLYLIGTDTAKTMIFGRLKLTDPGPGYLHFPRALEFGYDEVFFSGLTAEEARTKMVRGRARRVWVKTKAKNEPLDIRVYNQAALAILQPDWRALAKHAEKLAVKLAATRPSPRAIPDPEEADPRKTKEYRLKPRPEPPPEPPPPAKPAPRPPSRRPGRRPGGWIKGWR